MNARFYIKSFRSLNTLEPSESKVRHHLNSRGCYKTHDVHFIFVDGEEGMVLKEQQGIEFHVDSNN